MIALVTRRRLPDVEPGPCVGCDGPPTRTLGRFRYCQDCADEVLDDIRARALARTGVGVGVSTGPQPTRIRPPRLRPGVFRMLGDMER